MYKNESKGVKWQIEGRFIKRRMKQKQKFFLEFLEAHYLSITGFKKRDEHIITYKMKEINHKLTTY